MSKSRQKVRFPISLKLVLIFAVLVIIVLGITTYMVSTLVRKDEQIKAEETNLTINDRSAESVQTTFVTLQQTSSGLLNTLLLLPVANQKAASNVLFNDFCERNESIVFITGPHFDLHINKEFESNHINSRAQIGDFFMQNDTLVEKVKNGSVEIVNISSFFNSPVLCIIFPYSMNGVMDCAAVAFDSTDLSSFMSTGSFNSSFIINKYGKVLVHSDRDIMIEEKNFSQTDAIAKILSSGLDSSQSLYKDDDGRNKFFAYNKIAGDMYVITTVSEEDVFAAINKTTYRIIIFSLAVFFCAIIIILLFSKSLTKPLIELTDASHEIGEGKYNINLKTKTHDEVGVLTSGFIEMSKGLAERERLMSSFSKFTNKDVASRAARGELTLGGETKSATIFFSDIRSFTAISEKMQPYEVVDFLNDYMTRMVKCVNKTGGIVDKFIGDAIMAEWGVPQSTGSAEQDAWNAVKTALMMRYTLIKYNNQRKFVGQPPIRIGCGINSGPVVAGQIGSSERMEYTVIGDAVNLASRTESLNKPFATDILITENTWKLISDKIISEEMPAVHVKGKQEAVKIFAVINAIGLKGPQTINELRTLLGVETPDLEKVDTDAEEKKYKIGS